MDLPLLTAMMRERGLPVRSCQLTDRKDLHADPTSRKVVVNWSAEQGIHQRDLARWIAGCTVINEGFQSNADQSRAA